MSGRDGVHPLIWLGAGAAGVWGASHFWPRAKPRKPAATPPPASALSFDPSATSTGHGPTKPPALSKPIADGAPISRDFDPIFHSFALGSGIPVAYLRALAWSESRLRPELERGLFQITPIARNDYAQRHKVDPTSLDLKNPGINTAIAVATLTRIKERLATKHAQQVNTIEDWSNPRFVELLTYSWNAGWSESRGVGRVLSFLEAKGQLAVTIDDIAANARAAGAVSWLYAYPARMLWARGVAARFAAERARDAGAA